MDLVLAVAGWLPPILVTALLLHASHAVDVARLGTRTQRDDWIGARDAAARVLARRSNLLSRGNDAQARLVAGIAEQVVGSVPGARGHLEHLLDDRVPARLRVAGERQLASVDRLAGDLDRARARLDRLPDHSTTDAHYQAVQLALVALGAGDPAEAARQLEAAPDLPVRWYSRPSMRRAIAADHAQGRAFLARARRQLGHLDAAAEALAEAEALTDGRPYIRASILGERGELAAERGDTAAAEACLVEATGILTGMGAAVDAAQVAVALGRLRRDAGALDVAEATFRERGALLHLAEVAEARRRLDTGTEP